MLVHEIAHQPARVDRHRAVEEDRDVAEASLRAQTRDMIEKRLNPSHGEGRDHHRPASLASSPDLISTRLCRNALLLAPLAIGAFHQNILGPTSSRGTLPTPTPVTTSI